MKDGVSSDGVTLTVDGFSVTVPTGVTVAAALHASDRLASRRSPAGELRGPLCGMGICFECRVKIDGRVHQRSCRATVHDGMWVETDRVAADD